MERQRRRQGCRWMLGALLTVGMGVLLSLVPGDSRIKMVSASEERFVSGDWEYQLDKNGNAIITDYFGNADEIVLEEKMEGHTIVAIGLEESYHIIFHENLKKISLPDSITRIENYIFSNCTVLSEIKLPNQLSNIGGHAFENCSSLWSIKFPENLQSIDAEAFSGCHSLTNVVLPAGLKKIGSTSFRNCGNLVAIQLDDRNQNFCLRQGILYNQDQTEVIMACDRTMQAAEISEGVKKINEYAFFGCDYLASVSLPNSLEYIGDGAFGQCSPLQQFVIPKDVTEIGKEILYNCCDLKSVKILGSLKELNGICSTCVSLEQVSLPDGLRNISSFSFRYCRNLKKINLPESVEVIEEYAFDGSALTSLLIPSGVTQIEERALTAPNLESITLAEDNKHFYTRPEGLYNNVHTLLASVVTGSEVKISSGCIRIGAKVFYERNEICKVKIPDTVKEIGEEAFSRCWKLTEVHMGNQLQAIGRSAFWETPFLSEQAEIENGVQYLASYAISCLEESAGEVLQIREGCTLIGDNFSISNNTLKYLWLPDSLQYIGKDAFWNNSSLQEILGGSSLVSIGERAFMYCNLERVLIRGKKVSIGTDAFGLGLHHLSEFMVDAEEVVLSEYCFGGTTQGVSASISTLVLPNLNISLHKTGLSYISLYQTKLLLTNMPAETLNQKEEFFADCEGLQLYLPYSKDTFTIGDSLLEQGVSVSHQNEWHLCRFMIHGQMKKLDILSDGAAVTSPIAEGDRYFVTSEGPLLDDIQWDLDGDGVADELPETIHQDIKAEALYHIQEEKHDWLVKEVFQELTCTQDGDTLYYCAGCGEEKRVLTKAQGHVFSKDWIIDQNASCTENGEKSHHCSREGCTERDSVTPILQTGHSWDAGVITIDPQIGVEGEKVFTCTICGEQRKETVAALSEPTNTPIPTSTPKLPLPSVMPAETIPPLPSVIPDETIPPLQSIMPGKTAVPNASAVPAILPIQTRKIEVLGFQAKAGYSKITLSWIAGNTNVQYWIYRSEKRSGRKKLLKKISGNQSKYSDQRVAAGRSYYYQIKVMWNDGGNMKFCGNSQICKAALKVRKAPDIRIRKRRQGKIRYLEITLRKYTGKRLEIFYRKRKTGAYRKLKLRSNTVTKHSKFRIKYLSNNGKLFFRFRTYQKQGKMQIYSRYTAEKKVDLAE